MKHLTLLMSNPMEVDSDALPQTLGSPFTIKPAVASLHPLQQDAIDELNLLMNDTLWSESIERAGDDLKKRGTVFARILAHASGKLILVDAKEVIESLDERGLKEWQDGVEAGINNRDWAILASHPILRSDAARVYIRPREDQEAATEKSWELPFEGDAALGLRLHIATHHDPKNLKVYAHFSAIVQSSGMGKSRTVDELAKDVFVIPLNLRAASSTGYPPADHSVREYLTSPGSQNVAYDRVCAFLEALFKHTATKLSEFDGLTDYVELARKFRSCMTEGQKMTGHNRYREDFYRRVIEMAKLLETGRISINQHFSPYIAFQGLAQALGLSHDSPSSVASSKRKKNAEPPEVARLVVLAFDEAHTTARQQVAGGAEWSVFNELRHALRGLHGQPLFSLFLSTSGKISLFTSAIEGDLSKRVVEGTLVVIKPYTDLGFDPLACIISLDGTWNLEKLTADAYMFRLGRPLFAARYMQGSENVKREIIQFAAAKLLNADWTTQDLSNHQALACLSQRIPIEFNSANYTSRQQEMEQVEGYMRVCLKVDAHFETITTSSSEPILSEAAYFIMKRGTFNAVKELKSVMEGFSISKGDRGEFLVLLLLILARDSAVGAPDAFGRPITGKRWFGLATFIYGHLFRRQPKRSPELPFTNKKLRKALRNLRKDFPTAQLHFSHFVKVHEYAAIDMDSLLLLQGRGAAVLCATNQIGVDAIHVFLKDGTELVRENAGLTLLQMKNYDKYDENPKQEVLDAMDPYDLKILQKGDDAVPLIKIVFALAAKTPSLCVVRREPTEIYNAVVFEIWCAGLSPEFLKQIKTREVGIWSSLLQASYGWKDLYKTTSNVTANLRKSTTPGAARDAGHYSRWAIRS